MPRDEIDEVYLDGSYYLAPDDKWLKRAFRRDPRCHAQERHGGAGALVLAGRERILMIEPRDKGLLATTLHYKYEVRDEKPYFESFPI